ncbi:biotin synthase auxiliary protein BsaP [Lentzea sp. NPDC055074]
MITTMYCSFCGKEEADGDHAFCRQRLSMIDPPRYCPECARRMVVQVTPDGWTARCSRHGETASAR